MAYNYREVAIPAAPEPNESLTKAYAWQHGETEASLLTMRTLGNILVDALETGRVRRETTGEPLAGPACFRGCLAQGMHDPSALETCRT